MKKTLCKILSFVMTVTSISALTMMSADAATKELIWNNHYTQDFQSYEEGSASSTTTEVYNDVAAPTIVLDGTNKYLQLTPSNVTTNDKITIFDGTTSQSALDLRAFDATKEAASDVTRLKYKIRLKELAETTEYWKAQWGIHTKIFGTAYTGWSLRYSVNRHQFFGGTAVANENVNTDWYDVEYIAEGKSLKCTISQNGTELYSGTKTATADFALKGYLMGHAGAGDGIYIDDITVDYGTYTTIEKAEDLVIDFEGLTAESAFSHDNVTIQNTVATVKAESDNSFLRLACQDKESTTKNSVQVYGFGDYTKTADKITISYDVRLPEAAEGAASGWATMPSVNTKIKGFNSTGGAQNTWVARVRANATQAISNAAVTTTQVGTEWFNIKAVIDNSLSTNNLTVSITPNGGEAYTKTGTYAPATYSFLELIVTDTTLIDYIDVDNIKFIFTYEAPEAEIAIYEDATLQNPAEVSAAANKITVTFDKEVKESTVGQSTIKILDKDGEEVVYNGTLSGNVYTMVPNDVFGAGLDYTVLVDGVESKYGAKMAKKELVFTIAGEPALDNSDVATDFALNFEEDAVGSAFENDKVTLDNVTAVITNTEADGNFLRISCVDKESTTKNTVRIAAFDNAETANKIVISYKARVPEATEGAASGWATMPSLNSKIRGFNANGNVLNTWAVRARGDMVQAGDTASSTIGAGTDWFTVEHVIDNTVDAAVKENLTTTITIADGTEHTASKKYAYTDLDSYELVVTDTTILDYVDVDDFQIEYIYNVPAVTAEDVVFVSAEGEDVTDLNNVPSTAKAVRIDFGATMNTETITDSTVYITKKGDTAKVAYVPTYTGTELKLTLSADLDLNAEYELCITPDVKNVKGDAIADTKIPFKTGKGEFKATLSGIKAKATGTPITTVQGLAAAGESTVEISYSNSTKEAKTLNVIIAYYKGNVLSKAEIVKADKIDAEITSMTYKYDFVPASLTDITDVKVMLWEDFKTMESLSNSINLQ